MLAELGERLDPPSRLDLAAERRADTRRARRRAAASRRAGTASRPRAPSSPSMRPNAALGGRSSRQHRVRREPGEEAARLLAAEREPRERRRRRRRPHAEARQRERMRGNVQRREDVLEQRLGIAGERREEPPPARLVLAEPAHGRVRRALEQGRGSVVERVRERRRRLDPLEAVLRERQRAEERRRDAERVDRRADVVDESRQRQLGRARAAAHGVGRLEHAHRDPGPRQHDRRRQPVRPGADDDRVRHRRSLVSGVVTGRSA